MTVDAPSAHKATSKTAAKVDEIAELKTPKGVTKYKIVSID